MNTTYDLNADVGRMVYVKPISVDALPQEVQDSLGRSAKGTPQKPATTVSKLKPLLPYAKVDPNWQGRRRR